MAPKNIAHTQKAGDHIAPSSRSVHKITKQSRGRANLSILQPNMQLQLIHQNCNSNKTQEEFRDDYERTGMCLVLNESKPSQPTNHQQSAPTCCLVTAPYASMKNKKLFPQKLWELIHDEKFSSCLRWADDGESVYLNRDLFEESYLKTNENQFHTQKAISFVRQMNMYGFRKIDDNLYKNENFKRNSEHLLKNMTRKHPNNKSKSERYSNEIDLWNEDDWNSNEFKQTNDHIGIGCVSNEVPQLACTNITDTPLDPSILFLIAVMRGAQMNLLPPH